MWPKICKPDGTECVPPPGGSGTASERNGEKEQCAQYKLPTFAWGLVSPQHSRPRRSHTGGYLVDPASSHMLVSKIKPCMSKYELVAQ